MLFSLGLCESKGSDPGYFNLWQILNKRLNMLLIPGVCLLRYKEKMYSFKIRMPELFDTRVFVTEIGGLHDYCRSIWVRNESISRIMCNTSQYFCVSYIPVFFVSNNQLLNFYKGFTMNKVLLVLLLSIVSHLSFAEELTKDKKRVIDEMLQITGALEVGEMMGTAVANQMIDAMSQGQKDLDPKIITIVQDEVGKIMHDQFIANGFISEMSYTIYHKHFTLNELKEIVEFYKTPTGGKMAILLPQITQEGMLAGQMHGQSLGPIIQKRLMARFEKEGIK